MLADANALVALPEVRFAEPDMIFTGRGEILPNDPGFSNCWGLHNTGQSGGTPDMDLDGPEAWEVTTGDASTIVLVIDTGVQQNHPDLNQIPGTDTTSDGPGNGGPISACESGKMMPRTSPRKPGFAGEAADKRAASPSSERTNSET